MNRESYLALNKRVKTTLLQIVGQFATRFHVVRGLFPHVRFGALLSLSGADRIVTKHIMVRRMWAYVHMKAEPTPEELAHMFTCQTCLSLFRICVLATPSAIDFEEDDGGGDAGGGRST